MRAQRRVALGKARGRVAGIQDRAQGFLGWNVAGVALQGAPERLRGLGLVPRLRVRHAEVIERGRAQGIQRRRAIELGLRVEVAPGRGVELTEGVVGLGAPGHELDGAGQEPPRRFRLRELEGQEARPEVRAKFQIAHARSLRLVGGPGVGVPRLGSRAARGGRVRLGEKHRNRGLTARARGTGSLAAGAACQHQGQEERRCGA